MFMKAGVASLLVATCLCCLVGTAQQDSSSHTTQLITVESGVQLEVLDWGGSGPPLVFLGGTDAHVFDGFAPRFTSKHHVYGISQQGFGRSSAPAPTAVNYTSN